MAREITEYRIFIASPSGLEDVRLSFRSSLTSFNTVNGDLLSISYRPVGWECSLPGAGRPQSRINSDLQNCDFLVLVLHNRWGTPTTQSEEDLNFHSSGSYEEFCLAEQLLNDPKAPMKDIAIFFRGIDPEQLADPGPQLKSVLEFQKNLQHHRKFLYQTFDTVESFHAQLSRSLIYWAAQDTKATSRRDNLSSMNHQKVASIHLSEIDESGTFRVFNSDVYEAEELLKKGHLFEAEACFAKAIVSGNNLYALNRYGHFLRHVGRYDQASVMYNRVIALATPSMPYWVAKSKSYLALIHFAQHQFDNAEALLKVAIAMQREIGDSTGESISRGNLGLIKVLQNGIDEGRDQFQLALRLARKGQDQTAIANQLLNVGLVFFSFKQYADALSSFSKALKAYTVTNNVAGQGVAHTNIGLTHLATGLSKSARSDLRKALEKHKAVGNSPGMASCHFNLGKLYLSGKGKPLFFSSRKASLKAAEKHFLDAIKLDLGLCNIQSVSYSYLALSILYKEVGNSQQAQVTHQKWLKTRSRGSSSISNSDISDSRFSPSDKRILERLREIRSFPLIEPKSSGTVFVPTRPELLSVYEEALTQHQSSIRLFEKFDSLIDE